MEILVQDLTREELIELFLIGEKLMEGEYPSEAEFSSTPMGEFLQKNEISTTFYSGKCLYEEVARELCRDFLMEVKEEVLKEWQTDGLIYDI